MRVAFPVWEGRISPVFDTSGTLLVVDCDGSRDVGRIEERLDGLIAPRRAARLSELGVHVLICGALSHPLRSMLVSYGIHVVPFVSGEVEQVLSVYLSGGLEDPGFASRFRMPGCRGGRMRFRRGHGGRGQGGGRT